MEKKINKKLKTLQDLQALTVEQRSEQVFNELGLSESQVDDINTFMSHIPSVYISAKCYVEGEEGIKENDQITVKVTCLVTRPAHATGKISPGELKGKSIEAYHPNYKYAKNENWYMLVADTNNNHLYGHTKTCLLEAERKALENPEAVNQLDDSDDTIGQVVEFKLNPRLAQGTFNLTCICMCDSYIGVECKVPLVISVEKLADQEQRGQPVELDSDGEPPDDSDDDSDDDDDNKDYGGSDGEYDSEETGEEVTDDEAEDSKTAN